MAFNPDSFSEGFEQGWQSVMSDMRLTPMVPFAPLAHLGKTDFQMGILEGVKAAFASSGVEWPEDFR